MRLFDKRGLTLVEVIVTLSILGLVICPLMNLLVLSEKINSKGENEYKTAQTALYYMEEVRAAGSIDTDLFDFNSEEMCYERTVFNVSDKCRAKIRITPGGYGLHYIEVDILNGEEVIYNLTGSMIYE